MKSLTNLLCGQHKIILAALALLGNACLNEAAAQEKLTLLFNERPPYLVLNRDGSASGLTGTPAANAFKAAGIPVLWTALSTKRQMQILTENMGQSCAIGWFQTKEREQFAKFTKAIYRDHPFVALAASNVKIAEGQSLEQVLADKNTRVLVKEGFSYGDIDPVLARAKASILVNSGEVVELMQMIKARRADIMFAAQEEANYLLQNAGFKPTDFRMIKFSDMPSGKTRHIMCSKKVPDETTNKLNAAIQME